MSFAQSPRWRQAGSVGQGSDVSYSRHGADRRRTAVPLAPRGVSRERASAAAPVRQTQRQPPRSPDVLARPHSGYISPTPSRRSSTVRHARRAEAQAAARVTPRKRAASRAPNSSLQKRRPGARPRVIGVGVGVVRSPGAEGRASRPADSTSSLPQRSQRPARPGPDREPTPRDPPSGAIPLSKAASGTGETPVLWSRRSPVQAAALQSPAVLPPPPRPSLPAADRVASLGSHTADMMRPRRVVVDQQPDAAPRSHARAIRLVRAARSAWSSAVQSGMSAAQLGAAAKAARLRAPSPAGRVARPRATACRGAPSRRAGSEESSSPRPTMARPSGRERASARQLLWRCEDEDAAVEEARFVGRAGRGQLPARTARGFAAVRLAGPSSAASAGQAGATGAGGGPDAPGGAQGSTARPMGELPQSRTDASRARSGLLFPDSEDEMIAAAVRQEGGGHGTEQEMMIGALAYAEFRRQVRSSASSTRGAQLTSARF